MAYKVFISHSATSEDAAIINQILQHSATLGIQCYMAEHDVQAGLPLKDKLQEEIQAADCLLAFVTRSTASSDWVKWEVGIADGMRKLVIPVVEQDIPLPGYIHGKEYISCYPADPAKTATSVSAYLTKLKVAKDNVNRIVWLVLLVLGAVVLFSGKK